jgi:hypothetical protein
MTFESPTSEMNGLPYGRIITQVLEVVHDSLAAVIESDANGSSDEDLYLTLRRVSEKLVAEGSVLRSGGDAHVTRGIREPRSRQSAAPDPVVRTWRERLPRISLLCLEAVSRVRRPSIDTRMTNRQRGTVIPSPLALVVEALTDPGHPESAAFAYASARELLCSRFKIALDSSTSPADFHSLDPLEVREIISSFRTYAEHGDPVHSPRRSAVRDFLGHFLGMLGVFNLRFGTLRRTRVGDKGRRDCIEYLREHPFVQTVSTVERLYEFRVDAEHVGVPETEELLNTLFGIPSPIAGASTIFLGGWQFAGQRSLVVNISGPPGSGKTSLALSIAANLAPLGVRCAYLTFEDEEPDAILRRASGLVPSYFRRTSLWLASGTSGWIIPKRFDPGSDREVPLDELSSRFIRPLREFLGSHDARGGRRPAAYPPVIVLDSISPLIRTPKEGQRSSVPDAVENLMRELRAQRWIVLVLSAEGLPADSRLEYLVDTVISLRHAGTESTESKPTRLFQLTKTRMQISRPGAHVLHMSGDSGVRLAPQLPSVLEVCRARRAYLRDYHRRIDTLRPDGDGIGSDGGLEARLVEVPLRSSVVIYGRGSAGKAGLALRILSAPILDVVRRSRREKRHSPGGGWRKPKILVIAFLSPEEHYERIVGQIRLMNVRKVAGWSPEYLTLSAGFLLPEDFLASIRDKIESARLMGRPYSGVLLDGIHNAFLQFPNLQRSDLVWPALYDLLRRFDLTVVTTYSMFGMIGGEGSGRRASDRSDEELLLRGQLPFRHVLAQSADVLLRVEPVPSPTDGEYAIHVESAPGRPFGDHSLAWSTKLRFGPLIRLSRRDQQRSFEFGDQV